MKYCNCNNLAIRDRCFSADASNFLCVLRKAFGQMMANRFKCPKCGWSAFESIPLCRCFSCIIAGKRRSFCVLRIACRFCGSVIMDRPSIEYLDVRHYPPRNRQCSRGVYPMPSVQYERNLKCQNKQSKSKSP